MSAPIRPVDLAKAYRLLNHGPTVLVSARHQAVDNVMAAAWCCALDFDPPKLTLVLDKATRTRALIEGSGLFAIQVPTVAQLQLTQAVGNASLADDPAKLVHAGVELFTMESHDLPLVAGCSAWAVWMFLPAGPHAKRELTNKMATPGAGALPDPDEEGDCQTSTG